MTTTTTTNDKHNTTNNDNSNNDDNTNNDDNNDNSDNDNNDSVAARRWDPRRRRGRAGTSGKHVINTLHMLGSKWYASVAIVFRRELTEHGIIGHTNVGFVSM